MSFFRIHSGKQSLSISVLGQLGFPSGSVVKNPPADAEDAGSILGFGRSLGEGHSNSLQCSYMENLMDRGAWRATVHGVVKSWTHLKWTQQPCGMWDLSSLTGGQTFVCCTGRRILNHWTPREVLQLPPSRVDGLAGNWGSSYSLLPWGFLERASRVAWGPAVTSSCQVLLVTALTSLQICCRSSAWTCQRKWRCQSLSHSMGERGYLGAGVCHHGWEEPSPQNAGLSL